jgi:hypothetical protein
MKIIAPVTVASVEKESINDLLYGDKKDPDFIIDLSSGVNVLCSRADEEEIEIIIDAILGEVIHNGKGDKKGAGNCRDNYDAVFLEASIPHVYKVIYTALGVEYSNFFGEGVSLDAIIKQAKDLIPGKSQ